MRHIVVTWVVIILAFFLVLAAIGFALIQS